MKVFSAIITALLVFSPLIALLALLAESRFVKVRRFFASLRKTLTDYRLAGAFFLIAFLKRARYIYRTARYQNVLLGARSNFQEIRQIIHQVERGEWYAELGDPLDHIMHETRQGLFATASLLYDSPNLRDKTR